MTDCQKIISSALQEVNAQPVSQVPDKTAQEEHLGAAEKWRSFICYNGIIDIGGIYMNNKSDIQKAKAKSEVTHLSRMSRASMLQFCGISLTQDHHTVFIDPKGEKLK